MNRNDVRFQAEESCVVIPSEYCESIEYWLKKNAIEYAIEGPVYKPGGVDMVFFEEDGSPRYNYLSCLYTQVVVEDMRQVVNAIVFDDMVRVCWRAECDQNGNPIGKRQRIVIDHS